MLPILFYRLYLFYHIEASNYDIFVMLWCIRMPLEIYADWSYIMSMRVSILVQGR